MRIAEHRRSDWNRRVMIPLAARRRIQPATIWLPPMALKAAARASDPSQHTWEESLLTMRRATSGASIGPLSKQLASGAVAASKGLTP